MINILYTIYLLLDLEFVGGLQLLLGYQEERTMKLRIIGTLTLGKDY
jgi:hypothetical protein